MHTVGTSTSCCSKPGSAKECPQRPIPRRNPCPFSRPLLTRKHRAMYEELRVTALGDVTQVGLNPHLPCPLLGGASVRNIRHTLALGFHDEYALMNIEFEKVNGVAILIAFAIPGYIARYVYSSVVTTRDEDEKTKLMSSAIASAWLYALAVPVLYGLFGSSREQLATDWKLTSIIIFSSLFAYPLIAGYTAGRFISSEWGRTLLGKLRIQHPIPRAWDYAFSRPEQRWILVTLNDSANTQVGGLFDHNSFAGDDIDNADIFISRQYRIGPDGTFMTPLKDSAGVYIERKNIRAIQFFSCEWANHLDETQAIVDRRMSADEQHAQAGIPASADQGGLPAGATQSGSGVPTDATIDPAVADQPAAGHGGATSAPPCE